MSKSTPKSKASAASGGVALSTAAATVVRIARGRAWDYNDAINMNESRKVFYLYRGVLIVLVVALPDCTEFLGFELDYLLRLDGGDITKDQFDKAVWLICNAMNYLDRGIATSVALGAAYATDYGRGRYFIENFTDEMAKRGLHTVIAKSISRIVIRFLFAFSLNLRGLNAANVAAHVVVPGAGDGAGAGDEERITSAITQATGIIGNIQAHLPNILTTLFARYSELEGHEDRKQSFIQEQFGPIISDLRSLGREFQARVDDIVLDINNLPKPLGPVTPEQATQLRDQVIRISPRTFRTKVLTLEGFIIKSTSQYIRELTDELEKMRQDRETRHALDELLQSAGNTFKGLHPISGIVVNASVSDRIQIQNGKFVQSLLEKALVMQANISKLLLTPVTIAYKPSIQEFLSRIGLLDSNAAAAITGDDEDDGADGADDDDSAAHPLAKRLRRILEPVGAQSQCEQTIGKLGNNPSIRCYICGGGQTGVTMECEHIFCIGLAIEYFGLLRCSGLSDEEKYFLSILYAWAHRCCNRLKSNISFMKVNPNYKIPQPRAAAAVPGRNNFFMFHQENASKLLGEIYNNDRQHDCIRIIDRFRITKAQFVSAKVPVVSANVLPLVDIANTVFGTVFAASTVLFTAMSCFKNIASLLVIQAAIRGGGVAGNALTLNTGNMIDGFNSILPGVISDAPGRGGSRMKKNNYVGGMQPASNERPPPPPPQSPPVDVQNFLTNILGKLTLKSLELEEPIQEELTFYHDRRTHIEEQPIICEHENPESVTLDQHGNITHVQKYSFLFKLTSITHNLNPMCLYSQLLLETEDDLTQISNINVFGTICDNYIENNRGEEGIYTLNDLSVILLCQIAVDGLANFNNVTGFNVVTYISKRAAIGAGAGAAGAADNFSSFSTSIETIFTLTSRVNFPGGPIRHHTGTQVYNTNRLRETFTKLCLLRLNRYKECFETASYLMRQRNEHEARTTVNNFIRDDLYLLYCPFNQQSRPLFNTELNLYKRRQFQTYLTSDDSNYLDFFEYMIDYGIWNEMFLRQFVREYIPPDNPDSQPPSSEPESAPPRRVKSAPPPHQRPREIPVNGDDTLSLGGRSLKKNKHNNTKKNKHRLRKPANSRRNKSNYKYKIKYTIKHHKSRRNNRSHRK